MPLSNLCMRMAEMLSSPTLLTPPPLASTTPAPQADLAFAVPYFGNDFVGMPKLSEFFGISIYVYWAS